MLTNFEEQDGVYTLSLAYQLGDITVSIAADKVEDRAGNRNGLIERNFTITSTNSNELATYTVLAPNPTQGKLRAEFPWAERGVKIIQVIDLLEHTLKQYQTTAISYSLETYDLEAGTYILKVISEGQSVTKLFVKQ